MGSCLSPFVPAARVAAALLLVALGLGTAMPASAYVVFLKDGNQIQTKEPPKIEGDKAILLLTSGTTSSLDLAEIDLEKTRASNEVDLGAATLIEGFEERDIAQAPPPPADRDDISQLIRSNRGLTLPEPRKRKAPEVLTDGPVLTPAGYLDLKVFPRAPYDEADIAAETVQYLAGQGIEQANLFAGSSPAQPLLEIVVSTEPAVFKALTASAHALAQIRDQFPDRVEGFELLLITDREQRGGQFLLTPDLAELLRSETLAPEIFFIRYVEF